MDRKIRKKKCAQCGNMFIPYSYTPVCSVNCALEYNMAHKEEVKKRMSAEEIKEWKERKKKIVEKLKTRSDYLNDLQKVFNNYIRERDKGLPCISCGCDLTNKPTNASHFWSVGSSPGLRFNENNVHASCVTCNKYKSGNIGEYSIRLPSKIGHNAFVQLNMDRNKTLKLTLFEIKEMIETYKQKIKILRNEV